MSPTDNSQYAPVIFQESVGISHNLSLLLAGFNGVAYFFSSLIPIWIIDRLGRRKLMMFAAAGQAVCMAVLAGTVSTGQPGPGIVAIVMLFLFSKFTSSQKQATELTSLQTSSSLWDYSLFPGCVSHNNLSLQNHKRD